MVRHDHLFAQSWRAACLMFRKTLDLGRLTGSIAFISRSQISLW
jgi:hypothetical protein